MSVEGGGCSGFQYKLDLEEGELSLGAEDVVVEREGARVVVDQTSLEYLQVGLLIEDTYHGIPHHIISNLLLIYVAPRAPLWTTT